MIDGELMTDKFLEEVKALQPKVDIDKVRKAAEFARQAHQGQKRFSGEPYVVHALETAKILAGWQMDTISVVAGLLHDTVEDAGIKQEVVVKQFGKPVGLIVEGVTKVGRIKLRGSTEEAMVENLRKMVVAMSKDLRVVLVKLADRLHNMRTLGYVPEGKRKRIARETLEVYAPLADRLGMGEVKGELEDLAFPWLHPADYVWLKEYSAPGYKKAEEDIEMARRVILKKLSKEGVKAEVHGRKKHLYSLYKKLLRPEINRDIDSIHDLVAMRILVDKVADCYTALGVVHKTWKPVPHLGVSDFIAQPKPNGYRSIHTKVFLNKRIVEIQIRTFEMHEEAEYGVAAHFHYAEVKKGGGREGQLEQGVVFTPEEKLSWVKQLVELQREIRDNKELIENLRMDVLSRRIFVFTPGGDVIDLPLGATPVDFAYALHSEIGDAMTGAKVNGKLVGLSEKLKSGVVCEILTGKSGRKPNQGWLDFVVTDAARRRIRKAWGMVSVR
jgi:guanosine-3',5'-bis(diphosphate) 3'-pyrophosphohydrolase